MNRISMDSECPRCGCTVRVDRDEDGYPCERLCYDCEEELDRLRSRMEAA